MATHSFENNILAVVFANSILEEQDFKPPKSHLLVAILILGEPHCIYSKLRLIGTNLPIYRLHQKIGLIRTIA